jgi:hypothetical protein
MIRRRVGVPAFGVVALLAGAACGSSTASLAPLEWQKVPGGGPDGSVLGLGAPGSFDERGNFTVTAFKDGDVIRLYYGGADATGTCHPGINTSHWRPGLATSTDGLTFTRQPGPATGGALLENGDAGKFDSFLTYRPFVLKDGSVYRMWYNGSQKPFNNCNVSPAGPARLANDRRIGYAESTDGLNFTKHYDGFGPGGSVLPLGGPGEIDEQQVGYVWVIKDGAEYKMFYSANDANNFWRVGLATSSDAHIWTKVRSKSANGAVLDLGPQGAFDVACAYQPTVVKEKATLYRMWYRGCQSSAATVGGPSLGVIGYAESNDGITWVKIPQSGTGGAALTAGSAGQFDSLGLTTPSVFLDGATWNMYYAGFDSTGRFLSGLAQAANR